MEKNVLFSMPLFRSKKNKKTFTFNNFHQALQAVIDEKLLYVEHYADMNFYIDSCKKVAKSEPRRVYFAEIKPYKELWYRAVNDKWLIVPEDFMYDKKYQYQNFLFSKRAREIAEIPRREYISLQDTYLQAIQGKQTIQLNNDERILNKALPVQLDIECCLGDGIWFSTVSKNRDFQTALDKIQQEPPKFIGISLNTIRFNLDATTTSLQHMSIYTEEDKISAQEALQRSNNSARIIAAIKRGEQYFAYNPEKNLIASGFNAIFVPRDTILNKWKF